MAASGSASEGEDARLKIQYKYAVSLTAALALFMAVLDSTIVNVALVSMERDFKTTINAVQWVVTGYILVQAAVIPVTGYFGNRFGVKRVFILALTLFTIGSLLCGLSPHFATGNRGLNLLIIFRLIQGIGGGMLFPLGTTISFGAFPPAERAASSAVIAIPVLFAPALGPTVGGLIVDSGLKWPGIFFINVPIGIITLILLARIVRPDEKAAPGAARAGFDYSGLFLSIIGVVLVVYAFVLVSQTRGGSITPQNPNGVVNGWGYWLVWALLGAGVLVLLLFSLLELFVVKDPVLDLRLFATRDFRVASIVTWVVRGIVFGSFLLIPIFLQQFQNRSAVETGLILMGQGIGAIIGIQLGSRLYDRIGPRALTTAGLLVLTGATFWLVIVKPDSGARFFVPILFLRGIGFGWSNLPLQTVGLGAITGRALGKATSLYNASAQIFSSIGTAVVTTILVQRTTSHASALVQRATDAGLRPSVDIGLIAGTDAVSDVFKLLTVGTAVAAVISLLLPKQSLKQQLANEYVRVPVMLTSEPNADGAASAPVVSASPYSDIPRE
jgi:EmrB/QacA subfamily drug resistance transporter